MKPRTDKQPQILLVEDDQGARQSLRLALKTHGFEVDAVENGLAALRRLADTSYHWMISDVRMPGIDGIELARRAKVVQPGVRIILISAYVSAAQLLPFGVASFLEKPIDLDRLLTLLHDTTPGCPE